MNVVIGTAGHIDHGKTALVKALTGVDADRLPEEKKRGITIDIGFAELDLGDLQASFIDVPGHERFVKNMLAGASGIDIVMLVVAADEGVMPQTREHFNICRLLGIRRGLIAITKSDLVDDETLELVKLEIAELVDKSFLESAPVIVTSSSRRLGLDSIIDAIRQAAEGLESASRSMYALLPIDRSFTVKGHGAVVTGTLQQGEIGMDSEVELLPAGTPVRVRALQSHGRASEKAAAGRRVAVNLGGIDHSSIARGMALAARGIFEPTQVVDTEIEILANAKPLRSRQRVRVHIGTSEILARVSVLSLEGEIAPGETDFVQLRLESPAVAVHGTRVILRSYSPQETIAGGRVLDPHATRHRTKTRAKVRSFLSALADADVSPADLVFAFVTRSEKLGISRKELTSRTGWLRSELDPQLEKLIGDSAIVDANGRFFTLGAFESLRRRILAAVKQHHQTNPLAKGISKETLRNIVPGDRDPNVFGALLNSLSADNVLTVTGESVSVAERKLSLTPAEETATNAIFEELEKSGLAVPKMADLIDSVSQSSKLPATQVRKVLHMLVGSRKIVKVSEEFYFAASSIDSLVAKLRSRAEKNIDVAGFKELAGISRKYAIPLLEYFDREKITIRAGDTRIIH